jgi:hypothetical protein
MGEARRKAQERHILQQAAGEANLPALSSALQRLTNAASDHFGADCYIHSALAQAILARLGVPSIIVVGWAGWRVGEGDSDVILHAPMPNMPKQEGVPYHAWLEVGHNKMLDFSTHSLRIKAKQLDELDGGHTCVDWCPEYLYEPKKSVASLRDVSQGSAGAYYYERNPEMEERVVAAAEDLDVADIEALWMLYQNPDLVAFGPCSN